MVPIREKPNTHTMSALAKAMSEQEIRQSAEYFAAMPWTKWIRVVEADRFPRRTWRVRRDAIIKGKEPSDPLGNRIVEAPEDDYQANTVRNPRSGFVAYVPVEPREGQADRAEWGRKDHRVRRLATVIDAGIVNIPAIAGRSPSYMMRQMWDMKVETRKGPMTQLMKPIVANLSQDDMLNVVAYLASINPPAAPTTTKLTISVRSG